MGMKSMGSQLDVRIVWGDCDEQGIVFYPKYFYWMDSAFQALLRDAGQSLRAMREGYGIVGIPIVEANARFLASSTHEEILSIEAEIRHWGETSLRAEYKGFAETDRSSRASRRASGSGAEVTAGRRRPPSQKPLGERLPHLDPRRQHESSPWSDRAASLINIATRSPTSGQGSTIVHSRRGK